MQYQKQGVFVKNVIFPKMANIQVDEEFRLFELQYSDQTVKNNFLVEENRVE